MTVSSETRWSDEDIGRVAARLNDGASFGRIALEFDVSRSAIAGLVGRQQRAGDPRMSRGANIRVAKAVRKMSRVDALAELMAEGASFAAAARSIGVSRADVDVLWASVCRKFGWQAA